MGIGYVIGSLISIMLWNFNRENLYFFIDKNLKMIFKNYKIVELIYIIILVFVIVLLKYIEFNNFYIEVYNLITALFIMDISNIKKGNLKEERKVKFYDSIFCISKGLVCGFIGPLFYVLLFGNLFAIVYIFIYYASLNNKLNIFNLLFIIFTIVPALITQIYLYIIYLFKNKKFSIDFKGDYIFNCLTKPMINVNIMAAYIQHINYYYYYNENNMGYLKGYGDYKNKIDIYSIRNYIEIAYELCAMNFGIFLVILNCFK